MSNIKYIYYQRDCYKKICRSYTFKSISYPNLWTTICLTNNGYFTQSYGKTINNSIANLPFSSQLQTYFNTRGI